MFYIHCCIKYSDCSGKILNNKGMNDCSLSGRHQTELLQDRCKMVIRSSSLLKAILGHDNDLNETLWILKGYAGSVCNKHSRKRKIIMPFKCNDPISGSGAA